jgi:hypothetical protein
MFLVVGGAVLLLLGLVGYAGIFSRESTPWFWLDDGENLAHTFLGVVALAAVYVPGLNSALRPYYRGIVALVGVIALFFAAYGFLRASGAEPNAFGLSNLENPSDNILHLVVGIVAVAVAWMSPQRATAGA